MTVGCGAPLCFTTVREVAHIMQVLDGQWLIEAQVGADLLELRLGGARTGQQPDRRPERGQRAAAVAEARQPPSGD